MPNETEPTLKGSNCTIQDVAEGLAEGRTGPGGLQMLQFRQSYPLLLVFCTFICSYQSRGSTRDSFRRAVHDWYGSSQLCNFDCQYFRSF